MALKSSSERYGAIAIAFHWLIAVLIVVLIGLGLTAANAQTDTLRRSVLTLHIGLGMLVLVLTLLRLAWRAFDRKPAPLAGIPPLQSRVAAIVHALAYGFVIALAITGIGTNVASGLLDAIGTGAPIPPLDHVPPRQGHGLLAWSFIALLVLHVGAALHHQFVRRDGIMARMGIGRLPPRTES